MNDCPARQGFVRHEGESVARRTVVQSIENIQLALFLRTPFAGSALELWQAAFDGNAPDGFNKLPNGQTQAQGLVKGSTITLLASTMPFPRIDLVIQGAEQQPLSPLPAPIRNLDEARLTGCAAVEFLAPKLAVGRTACVMQGYDIAADSAEATLKLKAMSPALAALPPDTQNITLQFVVPLVSSVSAARSLKQMRRYKTVTSTTMNIGFGGFQPPPPVAEQAHAAHFHVDVFAEHMEALTSEGATESLREVSLLAMQALQGDTDVPAG